MDKLHAVLAAAALVAVTAGLHELSSARAWERQVTAAESRADSLQGSVDSLGIVASVAEAAAAHTDTVRVTLTKLIPQTDSASRPDSTCTRSLAARDTVIATSALEVKSLQSVTRAQMLANARLVAEKDALRKALDARPKVGLALEALHPKLHVSLQAMVYPQARVGVGISYDLASVGL